MKAVLALTATLAVANASLLPRQISAIPQCALSCALGSLGSTGCATTDFACICKANTFIASLIPCVKGGCSASDYQKTINAASALCQQAGVSLSVPAGAAETGATSAAGSATSAATSAAAATTAASSEATRAASSAATSAASSAATSAATSPATSAVSSAAATTTPAPTKASGSNSAVSSTSPPKSTSTTGAASRNNVALGGLGAVIALVAAVL